MPKGEFETGFCHEKGSERCGMGSAVNLLCPGYSGPLIPLPLWLFGYGRPLPLAFTLLKELRIQRYHSKDLKSVYIEDVYLF